MTLNYIGSKLSLLEFINHIVNTQINEKIEIIGDLFAGTGIVGQYFKKKGFTIISNDIQYYSYIYNKKFIGINNNLDFNNLISEIPKLKNHENKVEIVLNFLNNSLDLKKGFIYENYCLGGTKDKEYNRLYFSDENALLIDTIRQKIQEWFDTNMINKNEFYYLLATLLEAADKVANTASVYGAFLKKLKKSALKKLELKKTEIIKSNKKNLIFNDDIINVISKIDIDLLYLDPPYNARQYCSNYHMLETISKYDNPIIKGKTGLRNYESQKSKFCSKIMVKEEFKKIITNTNAKYIILSYNNEGLMSIKDVQEILSIKGIPKTFTYQYKRFKADKTENRNHKASSTFEYLHFVKCEPDKSNIKIETENIIEIKNILPQEQKVLI